MIKTLLNPNHVLSDCDNISDIDGQRMATVLGKHIYGYKPSDPDKPIIKVLGIDANDDIRWNEAQSPVQAYVGGNGIDITNHVVSIDTDVVQKKLTAGPNIDILGDNPIISTEKTVVAAGHNISVSSSLDSEHRRLTYTVSAADPGSTVNKKDYGDTEPSRVSTMTIDSDDPEGYAMLKADGVSKGGLVAGPYKGLLDSGVAGVGDSSHPVYIGSDGEFHQGNAVGSTYTFGDGLTTSGTDVSVTRPVPAHNYDDVGKYLQVGYNGLKWGKPRQTQWGSSIGRHTVTDTDIANGYCDIPIYFWEMSDNMSLSGLTWFLLIEDAGYIRGSSSSGLGGYASTVKISWCDDEYTWQAYNSAHGGAGQLFDDLDVATELKRVPGYPELAKPIRRIGGDPTSGSVVRGPSFRVMLEPSLPQVGDIVSIKGKINVIMFQF